MGTPPCTFRQPRDNVLYWVTIFQPPAPCLLQDAKPDGIDASGDVADMKAELEKAKKEAEAAKKDMNSMKSQSESLAKEYDR